MSAPAAPGGGFWVRPGGTFAIEKSAQRTDILGETARGSMRGECCAMEGCLGRLLIECTICTAHYCGEHIPWHRHGIAATRRDAEAPVTANELTGIDLARFERARDEEYRRWWDSLSWFQRWVYRTEAVVADYSRSQVQVAYKVNFAHIFAWYHAKGRWRPHLQLYEAVLDATPEPRDDVLRRSGNGVLPSNDG